MVFKAGSSLFQYPRFQEDKHLAEAVKEHLSLMCNLVLQQKEQIEDLTSQIQQLNQVQIININIKDKVTDIAT